MQDLNFRARYRVTAQGLAPGERVRGAVMDVVLPLDATQVNPLTPVAKVDPATGERYQRHNYELPPMAITAALVAQGQTVPPTGTARNPYEFPYGLKAVGFVDPWAILYRQGRLTSRTFELVP